MIVKKIDIGIKSIDYAFHLGDIHIKLLKRHKEYRQVFSKIYETIKKRKTPNSIIYLAGDLVHSKLDLSPECINLLQEFLRNLGDICPTILIAGNHDCNLNNFSRLDSIEPVVNALNHPNIHYLKDSGIYQFGGIDWVVMSVWEPPNNFIKASDCTGTYKIALHHGAVNKAQTDVGYKITNDHVSLDRFVGFNCVMLGDVHRRQTLQTYKEEFMEIDNKDLDKYLKKGWEIDE